jgi:NAD(P)-dependent dehydrogenase (short-subunit alcohol dehydrogenase family)
MPENRVVLITGASSGFGRETARLVLARGFKVYGTSRNPSAKPQESGVGMIALDVDSDDSVQNGVKELLDEAGRLDVLVNNAGYVLTGGAEETSIVEAKEQFETDFFGPVRMAKGRAADYEEAGLRPDHQFVLDGRYSSGSLRGLLCRGEGRFAGLV